MTFADVPVVSPACIAAVGVVTDSPVTIVGAMVVGPEFGPLAALSRRARPQATAPCPARGTRVADRLSDRDGRHGGRSRWSFEAVGWVTLETIEQLSEVDFIFQVGPFSFVVALLAGAAGMLSLVSSKSAALVGVFISVTTVPAAGFAVVAATVGDWDVAAQSARSSASTSSASSLAGVIVLVASVAEGPVEVAHELRAT